jgi:hypothetical protein
MRLQWQQWMQMDEGLHKVKWMSDKWPSRRIPNSIVKGYGHDTKRPKNFIVVNLPQSMANGSVQHLANNAEDVIVVRMVILAGCVLSKAHKVNNHK